MKRTMAPSARRSARVLVALASCVLSLLSLACSNDAPSRADVIDPTYGDPCQTTRCADHGLCVEGEDQGPLCLCDVGYQGADCERCEATHHRAAGETCAPDKSCAELTENPCGPSGSCDDRTGVIACHCDPGYEGPRCQLCAPGYGRSADGECLQLVIGGGDGNNGQPTPTPPSGSCKSSTCSGHGACEDKGGQVSCSCEPGYAGNACEVCSRGYRKDAKGQCVRDERCASETCDGHGTCATKKGEPVCLCDVGFAGEHCEECATGFHEVEGGRCAPDEKCAADSCPDAAECADESGKPVCTCFEGYEGDACDRCASGYRRDYADKRCIPLDCKKNPIRMPGRADFETLESFPAYENNCVSNLDVDNDAIAFESSAGDGVVWACSKSTVYGVDSNHVFLEAGVMGHGKLIFAGPIAGVSFDYAARSQLDLEILADGVKVDTVMGPRRGKGKIALTFPAPITQLAFHALNLVTNQIALDNIVYAPPACP